MIKGPMTDLSCQLIRSHRKTLAIQVTEAGEVLIRAPKNCSQRFIDGFVSQKQEWILEQVSKAVEHQRELQPFIKQISELSQEDLVRYYQKSETMLRKKTADYGRQLGISYGRISVRQQKTRWGSCSRDGNLSFNWKLVFAPEPVMDYVIVHELCHRKEMNHSPRFWKLVEEIIPDYQVHRQWLRKYGSAFL